MERVDPKHPWIETTFAPVYIMRFPTETDDAELQGFCDAREQWAREAEHPCAWVADLRNVVRLPPTQRQLFADHLKRFEPHDVRFNRGSALVIPNGVLRGLVTAVFWLAPPKYPRRTFKTIEDALVWCQRQFASAETGTDASVF